MKRLSLNITRLKPSVPNLLYRFEYTLLSWRCLMYRRAAPREPSVRQRHGTYSLSLKRLAFRRSVGTLNRLAY